MWQASTYNAPSGTVEKFLDSIEGSNISLAISESGCFSLVTSREDRAERRVYAPNDDLKIQIVGPGPKKLSLGGTTVHLLFSSSGEDFLSLIAHESIVEYIALWQKPIEQKPIFADQNSVVNVHPNSNYVIGYNPGNPSSLLGALQAVADHNPTTQPGTYDPIPDLSEEGKQLGSEGRHEEAYERFKKCTELDPNWIEGQFNAGLSSSLAGHFDVALYHFQYVKHLAPKDLAARAKLVQLHQSLGQIEERDREREELFTCFAVTDDIDFKRRNMYCREQITINSRRWMILEIFEPKPPRYKIYSAGLPPTGPGKPGVLITLESSEDTTNYARERGQISGDQRVYTIEGFGLNGIDHTNLGMLNEKPNYEEFRNIFLEIVSGSF